MAIWARSLRRNATRTTSSRWTRRAKRSSRSNRDLPLPRKRWTRKASRSSASWPNKWKRLNPDLVARDDQGKPYTVRYEAVNAMLLNEFLKEHRKVEEQQGEVREQEATVAEVKSTAAKQAKTIAQQQKEIQALTAALRAQAAQIQRVSDQLALGKAVPRVVVNNR